MITTTKIDKVQREIKLAIQKIEMENNVKINFGGAKYDASHYKCEMRVVSTEKSKAVLNVNDIVCRSLGFTQNIIGIEFKNRLGVHKIIDIKTRNRKYPIITQCSNGKSYKHAPSAIRSAIGGNDKINRKSNLNNLLD